MCSSILFNTGQTVLYCVFSCYIVTAVVESVASVFVFCWCTAGVLFWWWHDIPHRHNHCSGNVVELFWLSRWSSLRGMC